MKQQFEELLKEWGPKHWSFGLRKNPELLAWIHEQTHDLPEGVPLPERVLCAITGERALCSRGKTRKFKSIIDGWGFCGRAGKCECAHEQIARKVSASKQSLSDEERDAIQFKREQTNLIRYGHINTGQTEAARAAHKAFYSDLENVRNQLRKQVATMMARYGVENAAHLRDTIIKRETTSLERYGARNPMQNAAVCAQSVATRVANGYCDDYYRRNYNRLALRLLEDYGFKLLMSFEEYEGTANSPSLSLECVDCGKTSTWRLVYHRRPQCPICREVKPHRGRSKEEVAIYQFIKEKMCVPDLISGDRQFIAPFEIDILSESNKLAIEYGGLYWHSELEQPDHMYHLNKLRAVEGLGFRLFTIFSDEWLDHPDIVKSKLCHLFGRIEDRRHARKLTLAEVSSAEANAFYERSHIQGTTHAGHHLGLLDGGQLIAAMSFAQARPSQGLPEHSFDLTRFATAPYMTVIGGASRLFSHFLRQYQPVAVVSYADRRWSDGGLYHRLGFRLDRVNPPSYSYVENYRKRHFRFNFRKDVLESILGDIEGTEWEIMRALGYDRIWDCGTYRFVWNS